MIPMFVIVILTLMLGTDLLWWLHADRRLRPLPRARVWRGALAIFMIVLIGGLLASLFLRRLSFANVVSLPEWFVAAIYIWHFFVVPLVLLISIIYLIVRGLAVLLRRKPVSVPIERPQHVPTLSRRQMLGVAVAAAPVLFTAGGVVRSHWQLDHFRLRRFEIALASLPKDLDGMTIAHVSDVHVGKFTNGALLHRIADATNELRADLVLMTGDLIDLSISDLPEALAMVRRIDPRRGLVMIEGNHDLFDGRKAFHGGVRAAGVPLLINEEMTLSLRGHPVQILGLQWGDRSGGGERLIEPSMKSLDPLRKADAFQILLAHHPHAFDAAIERKIPLTLAGHTHGGQLNLTDEIGFGPAMYRYFSGLYQKNDCASVVTNGVGNWFPVRANAPAEIAHITLRCKT